MRTIIVSNDAATKENFSFYKETAEKSDLIRFFENTEDAVEYVKQNPVDLVIMNTQMLEEKPAGLGYRLKAIRPNMIFLYVNAADKEAMNTLKLHVITYFLASLTPNESISNPSGYSLYESKPAEIHKNPPSKRVFVKTFGHFDLFIDGQPVIFQNRKAKEFLALLIDRHGGTITTEQAISVLWEDRPNDTATRNLCNKAGQALYKKLESLGIGDIMIWERGIKSIDVSKIDCDMYQLLDGKQEAMEHFFGEYMMEYSWAEERIPYLCRLQTIYRKKRAGIPAR